MLSGVERFPYGEAMKALFIILLLGVGMLTNVAKACDLKIALTGLVTEVVDADTIVLKSGEKIRLIGMQGPKLPLGRPGYPTWPLGEEAKAALEELLQGREVGLAFGGTQMDRYGRLLGQLYRDDGLWVQGTMVSDGWARVYSFDDNRACVTELLALERQARAARKNIWGHPYYAIRSPEQLDDAQDSYQLVEGTVQEVAVVRGRAYLNFGADWRQDFTVTLSPDAVDLFLSEGLDPQDYEGKRLRVRGWIEEFNGPEIVVTHPEQIELEP